jgi:hypothetical protein
VKGHERAQLRRQWLAELPIGAASRERAKSLGREGARVGGMRGVALRRSHELLGEHPPRAEAALLEGERDLIVDFAQ